MEKRTALEMAEAYSTDCMNGIIWLGDEAGEIVQHCWDEITEQKNEIIKLSWDCRNLRKDCFRLRAELDEANGVTR